MAPREGDTIVDWVIRAARDPRGVAHADIRRTAPATRPATAKWPAESSSSCGSAGPTWLCGSPDGSAVVHVEARCGPAAGLRSRFAAPPRVAVWLAVDSGDDGAPGPGSDAGSDDADYRSADGGSSAGSCCTSLSRCSSLFVPWTQMLEQHAAGLPQWHDPEPEPELPARPQLTPGAARVWEWLLAAASRRPVGVVGARWRSRSRELTLLGPPVDLPLPPSPPPPVRVPQAPCHEQLRRLRRPSPVWQPPEPRSFELLDVADRD